MGQESNKKITPKTNAFGVKVMGLKPETPKSPRVTQPSVIVESDESAKGDASLSHHTSADGSKKQKKKARSKSTYFKTKKNHVAEGSKPTTVVIFEVMVVSTRMLLKMILLL